MDRLNVENEKDFTDAVNAYCAFMGEDCDACGIGGSCASNKSTLRDHVFLQNWIDGVVRACNYLNHAGSRCDGCDVDECRGFCNECDCHSGSELVIDDAEDSEYAGIELPDILIGIMSDGRVNINGGDADWLEYATFTRGGKVFTIMANETEEDMEE